MWNSEKFESLIHKHPLNRAAGKDKFLAENITFALGACLKPRLRNRCRSRKVSEVFRWSRIPNKTSSLCRSRTFFRLRISNWIIFYITLQSREFLLKWYNFSWNFCWNREFLLCTTISIDCLLLQNCW